MKNGCAEGLRATGEPQETHLPGCILAGMQRIRIEQHGFIGVVWVAAWLFTIGFLHLSFGQGLLAIVLWPYYLGTFFSTPMP